jgi:branched-chain amino acid transport system permease protein
VHPLIVAVPFTGANLEQLVFNGIVAGTGYALVAVGFGLIINVTGRFHIAFGTIFALTAFVTGQVGTSWGLPLGPALLLGVAAGVLVATLIERLIYWPLDVKVGSAALLTIFIVSLGLSTAGEGGLSLIWSSQSLNITGFTTTEAKFFDIYTTNIALISLFAGWAALLITWALIRWTRLGRMIRAVRVNPRLSVLVGIRPSYVYMAVFAIGTALGGIDAVFVAANSTATPDMGQNPVLYAITVAFISRSASPMILATVAIGVGLIESLSGFVVQPEWSQVVIFGGLLLYVVVYALRQSDSVLSRALVRRRTVAPPISGAP